MLGLRFNRRDKVYTLGTAIFTEKSFKALASIRFDQKNAQKVKAPTAAKEFVDTFLAKGKARNSLVRSLGKRAQPLRVKIARDWRRVFHDPVFLMARLQKDKYTDQGEFTPDDVLSLAPFMFLGRALKGRDWPDGAQLNDLAIVVHPMAGYRTQVEGNPKVFSGVVCGLTRIIGTVTDGKVVRKVFSKFISHPFYQYHSLTSGLWNPVVEELGLRR